MGEKRLQLLIQYKELSTTDIDSSLQADALSCRRHCINVFIVSYFAIATLLCRLGIEIKGPPEVFKKLDIQSTNSHGLLNSKMILKSELCIGIKKRKNI
mmetsp:Transcript_1053/g.1262  ORF Transcript_1053/g.1262 Transcript_1053/m.1262 type:complete len:99 (+) Transcript_1053:109-405(+)